MTKNCNGNKKVSQITQLTYKPVSLKVESDGSSSDLSSPPSSNPHLSKIDELIEVDNSSLGTVSIGKFKRQRTAGQDLALLSSPEKIEKSAKSQQNEMEGSHSSSAGTTTMH